MLKNNIIRIIDNIVTFLFLIPFVISVFTFLITFILSLGTLGGQEFEAKLKHETYQCYDSTFSFYGQRNKIIELKITVPSISEYWATSSGLYLTFLDPYTKSQKSVIIQPPKPIEWGKSITYNQATKHDAKINCFFKIPDFPGDSNFILKGNIKGTLDVPWTQHEIFIPTFIEVINKARSNQLYWKFISTYIIITLVSAFFSVIGFFIIKKYPSQTLKSSSRISFSLYFIIFIFLLLLLIKNI
jgi:hypothetical protein